MNVVSLSSSNGLGCKNEGTHAWSDVSYSKPVNFLYIKAHVSSYLHNKLKCSQMINNNYSQRYFVIYFRTLEL